MSTAESFITITYKKFSSTISVFFTGLASILLIEIFQFLTKLGTFDVDDIILNVFGGLIGYLLYIGLTAIRNHLPKVFQKDGILNVISFIILLILLILILKVMGVLNI